MADKYLTFQKFNDIELANTIAERLKQNGIDYLLEDNQKIFDPSFANNTVDTDISIKIRSADFPKAHQTLENFYKDQLGSVDQGYYLFEFTDDELMEIISKPDEWGHFDYQLAQKILQDRGKEIKKEDINLLNAKRIEDLAKPERTENYWIYLGYLTAIFGGVFGIILGSCLAYFRKTLPDGKRVYAYSDAVRMHGRIIFVISIISLSIWMIARL
jgi:hypothetical protein